MEMTANTIQKYRGMSIVTLQCKAIETFNAWIRNRDKDLRCISCQKAAVQNAGHYFNAGHFPWMRFVEDNCHGQCIRCNYRLHGNLLNYQIHIKEKIGAERLAELELMARMKVKSKENRFLYIAIIEQYTL